MNKQELLLTVVGEECAEVHQRCSKALRFGMSEIQSEQKLSNKDRILLEFNDLVAAMELLFDCKSTDLIDERKLHAKKVKIEKYLQYSLGLGTVV